MRICELTTGRCASLCRASEVAFEWQPRPTTNDCFFMGQMVDLGLRFAWAASGTAFYVHEMQIEELGPLHTVSVQRLCLLP